VTSVWNKGASSVRRYIWGLVSAVVGLALVVDPSPARGDSATAPVAQDAPQAKPVIDRAQRAYAAGRKQDAIEDFKRAYELSGEVTLLFRLGEVSRELGQDLAAYRFYRAYLTRDPRGPHREAADRAARAFEARGGTGPAPAPAARPSAVRPPAVAPVAANAAVVAPSAATALPARQAPAPPVADLRAVPAPAPAPPLPRWLPWAGLAATVALGGGAVYTGFKGAQRYDELRASCGQTVEGCRPSDIDDLESRALTTNLLWAAAGVGAVATGVMIYVNTREAGFSGVWRF
jgi:hypothetical protein